MLRLISSLLLIATAVLLHTSAFSRVLLVPEEYETIQEAVNAAENGDTVLVRAGEYAEYVLITEKNVVLLSESGAEETMLTDTEERGNIVEIVDCDSVIIHGFTLLQQEGQSPRSRSRHTILAWRSRVIATSGR